MFMLSPYSTRNQFGAMLNERAPKGVALEIGTHRGDFAAVLLNDWTEGTLVCVDPWQSLPGYDYQEQFLPEKGKTRLHDMLHARRVLGRFGDRVQLQRTTSNDYFYVNPHKFDFVYVDGDHSYEHVFHDLCLWWSVLKPGGVLAGHDFICPGEVNGGWGQFTQLAVEDFIRGLPDGRNTKVNLIVEEGGFPWSFYIEKPEI